MADKDFKVKTGLDLPAPLPLAEGGTGQTSAENTINALMPVQTGHSGKFITTDGTGMSWAVAPQQTATDGAAGYKVYAGNTAPTGQNTGDIWIDASTGNGIQLVRWRKTIASSGSTLTGLDDNNLTLSYTAGNEQVYINGTLITRGQDYTATNGTSVVLTQAAEVGDTVEIFGNPLFSVTDVYTQSQANSLYVRNSNYPVAGKNKIINGDFGIWQRGTSFSSIANGSYSADRWVLAANKTTTITQQAFTPGSAPVAGYEGQYFLRAAWSADGTYAAIATRLEDCRLFAGQTVTLSYWAKSNINVINNAGWSQYFGSGGSSQISGYADNVTITTAWQRFTYTFTVPSISGKTVGSSNYFIVQPILIQTSSAYTIDVWGVQLESGSVATSFSTNNANPQAELAACQRYYQVFATGAIDLAFCNGYAITSTQCEGVINFPSMRTIPTMVVTTGTSYYKFRKAGGDVPLNSVSFALATPSSGLLFNSTNFTGGTAGAGGAFVTNNALANIALQAEL